MREAQILVYLVVAQILQGQTLVAEMLGDQMDWAEKEVVGTVHSKLAVQVVLQAETY